MKTIHIGSIEETNQLAEKIGSKLFPGSMITLSGDLGAGKTTFTKALGKSFGIEKTINSPTFTILKIYHGERTLYHIDAYRLEGIKQELGFEEVFEDDGVCVVEWPQFIDYVLPKDRLEISITNGIDEAREFTIHGIGEAYQKLEEQL